MFGGLDYNRPGAGYNEDSLFHPRSPYGVAKLYGHWIAKNYRESYGMFVSAASCSTTRASAAALEFVTRKITTPSPGSSSGCSRTSSSATCGPSATGATPATSCEGMWQMLQHDEPDDFVLATGETHSIEEFLTLAFAEIGIDDWRPYVTQNPAFMRPAEVDILLGDPTKAETGARLEARGRLPGSREADGRSTT